MAKRRKTSLRGLNEGDAQDLPVATFKGPSATRTLLILGLLGALGGFAYWILTKKKAASAPVTIRPSTAGSARTPTPAQIPSKVIPDYDPGASALLTLFFNDNTNIAAQSDQILDAIERAGSLVRDGAAQIDVPKKRITQSFAYLGSPHTRAQSVAGILTGVRAYARSSHADFGFTIDNKVQTL